MEPLVQDLAGVWRALHQPAVLWQLGLTAAALLAGWLVSRRLHGARRAADMGLPEGRVAQLGRRGLRRLGFPLGAAAVLLGARAVLAALELPHALVDLALVLMLALAGVRLVLFVLRHVFAPSGTLAAAERYVAAIIWSVVALHLVGVLPDIVDWLESIRFSVGKSRLTLWVVLQGLVTLLATLVGALWISGLIEARLLSARGLEANLRVVLARVAKSLALLLAFLLGLPLVGIDLTSLSVFGGALGVGLGFGLQKVASNYVSGFIILFERSIRIGNVIEVDRYGGEVTQITTRYTVLRNQSGVEILVPNEMMIGSVVQNQTYTTSQLRIALPVVVSYRNDVEQVLRLLEQTAAAQPRVLADPPPQAFLVNMAENGIHLELGFWIGDPERPALEVRSAVNRALWRRFKEEGIQVPIVGHAGPPPVPAT